MKFFISKMIYKNGVSLLKESIRISTTSRQLFLLTFKFIIVYDKAN
jgi:hypothetical protein